MIRAYKVSTVLAQVESAIKDAETGQRGYIITGKEAYLKPFYSADKATAGKIDQLISLITNERQLKLARFLQQQVDEKLDELRQTIEYRKTERADRAVELINSDRGQLLMGVIRDTIVSMTVIENQLLEERTVELDRQAELSHLWAEATFAFACVALALSAWVLDRFLVERARAEHELAIQYSIVKVLNESATIAEAVKKIYELICETTGWCIGAIWLVDTTANELRCFETWNFDKIANSEFAFATKTATFVKGQGLPGRVWADAAPHCVADVTKDDNFPRAAAASAEKISGAFGFPIKIGDEVIGVSEFFSFEAGRLDAEFQNLVLAMGTQLGQYINRKRIESETLKQREMLTLIVDTMSDGLVVANSEGAFVMHNAAAEELVGIGYTDGPPVGWSKQFGIFRPDRVTEFPPDELPLMRAINGETTDDIEMFVRNHRMPGGRWLSVSGRPIDSPEFKGGLVALKDVSERKEAEKRVSEFYSTVSHELRTPLTSIRGSLGLMEGSFSKSIPEKVSRLVHIARVECDRLIRLINDMLDIRKIEEGKIELKKTNISAETLLEHAVEGIQGMAAEGDVKVEAEINARGFVNCDHDRIIQVITNLLSNAIKFSPPGSKVIAKLEKNTPDTFHFSIQDSGPGIPKSQFYRLFGKFQQLDSSDSRTSPGTGLGLAITKAIVEQHGGKIGLESEEGLGSTFWFDLTGVESGRPLEQIIFQEKANIALVVEDDESMSMMLQEHLSADGFAVVVARSIAEAETVVAKTVPIVVILDLTLPDGSGLDFLHKLARDSRTEKVPVVVVTGHQRGTDDYGYPALVDWIRKPFDPKRFDAALGQARDAHGPAQVLIIEDDESTRKVLKQQLEPLGISCVEAADGVEAINSFRSSNPDLIILDLGIPFMDGFAVVDAIRQEKNGRKPLIVYTARDLTHEQKTELNLGITAYLTKSKTTQSQLVHTVKELLNGLVKKSPDDST